MKRLFKWFGILTLGVILLVGSFWAFLTIRSHQTYVLPKPAGAYHVGHNLYDWTDSNRTNTFAGKPQEKRELMADVWYPTNQTNGARTPYLPANWQKAADADEGGGLLLKRPLDHIQTNSISNAKIAAGSFPLVIFQPGYGRIAADYTSYAENLASQGYIVIASSPTYISDLVVLQNGTKITRTAQSSLPENAASLSPEMKAAAAKLLVTSVGDASFLIDKAAAMNADQKNDFYNRIDLSNIGEMGHSLGGAAAYQACKVDMRCKVAINMDGTLYGNTAPSRVPYLFISSDHSQDQGATKQEDDFNDSILACQSQPTYHINIANSAHFNFSDLALYSYKPVMELFGVVGSVNPHQAIRVSNTYVGDMLDIYLKQQSAHTLNTHYQPAGVTVQVIKPAHEDIYPVRC